MPKNKPVVFISHIHEEASLALALQEELLHLLLGGVDVFVSSDRNCVMGGSDWLNEIKLKLNTACIIVILASPQSIGRTWINFEAGAGWLKKRVVPLCHSGLRASQLSQPLASLQSFTIENPLDLQELCKLTASEAGLNLPHADWKQVSSKLSACARQFGPPVRVPPGASPCWVFPKHEDRSTEAALERSLQTCKDARFYSIGSILLWNAPYLELFASRVMSSELRARVCLGNVRSDAIKRRIDEEPSHPIGIAGREHLIQRLLELEKRCGDRHRFSINLFSNEPRYAMLLFDDEAYVYPYGFQVLGNFSPTFYWEGRDPAIQFFNEQFDRIWSESEPASTVYT
jgi:hypothetical protein